MSFATFFLSSLPVIAALPGALGLPHNPLEERQCTGCPPSSAYGPFYCPKVISETPVTGDAWQVPVSVKSGNDIAVQETYTIGSTWTVGAELGMSFERVIGATLAGSASYSESIERGFNTEAGYSCPKAEDDKDGEWRCSLLIYPGLTKIRGVNEPLGGKDQCPGGIVGTGGEWEAVIPRKDRMGNGIITPEVCNCRNLLHNGDPGAPERSCVDACVVPPPIKKARNLTA